MTSTIFCMKGGSLELLLEKVKILAVKTLKTIQKVSCKRIPSSSMGLTLKHFGGGPSCRSDGTVKVVWYNGDEEIDTTEGCIVKNDDNFRNLLGIQDKKPNYFAYIPSVRVDLNESSSKAIIHVYTDPPNKLDDCTVNNVKNKKKDVQEYTFVPCEDESFNNSPFLKNSKSIKTLDASELCENQRVLALSKQEGSDGSTLKFLKFKMEIKNGDNSLYSIKKCDFDKLKRTSPLFITSTLFSCYCYKKPKALVGYYNKSKDRMTIYPFNTNTGEITVLVEGASSTEMSGSIIQEREGESTVNNQANLDVNSKKEVVQTDNQGSPDHQPNNDATASREVLTTDDLGAPVTVSSEERAENSPSQPGTSNHSRHMAAGGSEDQVDNSQYPIQEQGTEDTYDPLEEIIRSLPNGLSQLEDDIRENEKRYRRFLLHVAQNAADRWQEIGEKLEMKDIKKRNLKKKHSLEGSEEQAYQMLFFWMNSDKNPTLEKLLRALIDAGLVEVAKYVSEKRSSGGKLVTEELLNKITKDTIDKWKFLGRYLGLDENDINLIAMNNRDDTWEQAHQMLIKWKQSNASRATSQVLINALKDVEKTNVASFVQEWEKAN